MEYETSVDIDAPPATVWSVLIDVERWPQWTSSMRRVTRLDSGAFTIGSRARVKQPRLPAAIWRVTACEPGTSFTWITSAAGVSTEARHVLTPRPGGVVTVTLSVRQSGPLAGLVGLLTSGLARQYVGREAKGLKQWCERGWHRVPEPGW